MIEIREEMEVVSFFQSWHLCAHFNEDANSNWSVEIGT